MYAATVSSGRTIWPTFSPGAMTVLFGSGSCNFANALMFRDAVRTASKNISAFAKLQLPEPKSTVIAPGLKVGQIVRPLDTVAAYIPAGRYPLPSTLMMTVIPAQVAGVLNICVCSPKPVTEVLGTASMLGVTQA